MRKTKSKRLVQWFGSNAMQSEEPCRLLDGCSFIGVPFAGGMSEVPYFTAKQILANDLHRHIINLCQVVAEPDGRRWLAEQADAMPYHPDVLAEAQRRAQNWDWSGDGYDGEAALWYFVAVWMGRGGNAGTTSEFNGKLPVRWNANGGGSNRRYRTAIEALEQWTNAFKRCEFVCMDAFEFLDKFQDKPTHGLYVDAPWPDNGATYLHSFDDAKQRRFAERLAEIQLAKVVVRFGEHPLIRELYPEDNWTWIPLESRNQANEVKPEFLICNRRGSL